MPERRSLLEKAEGVLLEGDYPSPITTQELITIHEDMEVTFRPIRDCPKRECQWIDMADLLAGCVDGVWLWWVNLEKSTGLPSFLENSKLAVAGRFPVYGGVYAHWTSWHKQGNPTPQVFRQTLEDTCEHADGTMIWNISLEQPDPLLDITKKLSPGGSSPLAGRCGQSPGMLATSKMICESHNFFMASLAFQGREARNLNAPP